MSRFDEYIAIDWSGAKGPRYDGIAVARCVPGDTTPKLVYRGDGQRWTRQAAADWLLARSRSPGRMLIGLDFAFSLPWSYDTGYFRSHGPGPDAFTLWDAINSASAQNSDLGCEGFLADPHFRSHFWLPGERPEDWRATHRLTETVCASRLRVHPESVLKLHGPKQVGKSSLTGMRALRHLRSLAPNGLSIWPFEPIAGSVVVEIFPTLFRHSATGSTNKLRERALLNAALATLGSRPLAASGPDLNDNETDALISAAGLRAMAAESLFEPVAAPPHLVREGWIFGVPFTELAA